MGVDETAYLYYGLIFDEREFNDAICPHLPDDGYKHLEDLCEILKFSVPMHLEDSAGYYFGNDDDEKIFLVFQNVGDTVWGVDFSYKKLEDDKVKKPDQQTIDLLNKDLERLGLSGKAESDYCWIFIVRRT